MAHLVLKSGSSAGQVYQLKLGINRFGRSPDNDFPIDHPTVSTCHCEISLGDNRLTLRDLGSTNGTFINGEPVTEGELTAGQSFCLGEVEFFVESAEVTVAIPKFQVEQPAPPVVLDDGGMLCTRHPEARVTHKCTFCKEVMCDACVHRLRRKGGKLLKLCPICSHACEPLTAAEKKKRSFLGFLQKTVKMSFLRRE
jgi:pSer/pThr/pTyr-binding forkhead associated (FHA) protein